MEIGSMTIQQVEAIRKDSMKFEVVLFVALVVIGWAYGLFSGQEFYQTFFNISLGSVLYKIYKAWFK